VLRNMTSIKIREKSLKLIVFMTVEMRYNYEKDSTYESTL